MIFEWYSGSDASGEVPKRIREISLADDEWAGDSLVSAYLDLLDQEVDRNWRGYIMYYLAHQYHQIGDEPAAKETLAKALEEFDVLASNFRDVENQYANTLFHLVKAVYWDTEDTDSVFELALRIIPYHASLGSGPAAKDFFDVLSTVGEAVFGKATASEDEALYRIALDFFLKAHHIEPDDPSTLARIVYAQYGAGQEREARRAFLEYERLEEQTGLKYQHSEHLREFIYSAFPDLLADRIKSSTDADARH